MANPFKGTVNVDIRPDRDAGHMACITEAAIGFPNASGTIPPENGMVSEILVDRGWRSPEDRNRSFSIGGGRRLLAG